MKPLVGLIIVAGCAKESGPLDLPALCADADRYLADTEQRLDSANPSGLAPDARCRAIGEVGARVIAHAGGMGAVVGALPRGDVKSRANAIVGDISDAATSWFSMSASPCAGVDDAAALFSKAMASVAASRQRIQTRCASTK